MQVVQKPASKRGSGKPAKGVIDSAKEILVVWNLNSPPVDTLEQDEAAMQIQAAAGALLEIYPDSIPHMKKQVRRR